MSLVYLALDFCESIRCLEPRSLCFHVYQKTLDTNRRHRSATVAAAMKLKIIYDGSHSQSHTAYLARGYQAMIWSTVEHGLSIFASSLLALRPLMRLVPHGWTALLSTFHNRGSMRPSGQGSSRQTPKKSSWSNTMESNELASFGVNSSVSFRTECVADRHARSPLHQYRGVR